MNTIIVATPVTTPGFAFTLVQTVDHRLTLAGVAIVALTATTIDEGAQLFLDQLNQICIPKESVIIVGVSYEIDTQRYRQFVWDLAKVFSMVWVVEFIQTNHHVSTRRSDEICNGLPVRFPITSFSLPSYGNR